MKLINRATREMYDKNGLSDASDGLSIARSITNAFTMSASNGLEQQIAIIEVMNFLNPIPNEYDYIVQGKLEFGLGEQWLGARLKESTKFDPKTASWVPQTKSEIEKFKASTTNKIERKLVNDYSLQEMKEYVRNSDTFASLVNLEATHNRTRQIIEEREIFRYILGIDNGLLPSDFKSELTKVVSAFGQHEKTINATDLKDAIKQLKELIFNIQKNPSDKYNIGSKTDGGNIFIDNSDSSVKPILNTWTKNKMFCITSNDFVNDLEIEISPVFHPEFWKDFKSMFGKFQQDTLPNQTSSKYTMYIFDPDVLKIMNVYDEYTNTYYPDNRYFHSLLTYAYHIRFNPYLNGLKITINITGREKSKESK